MIRRPPRSTQSRSSAASDVYKRQTLSGLSRIRFPAYFQQVRRRIPELNHTMKFTNLPYTRDDSRGSRGIEAERRASVAPGAVRAELQLSLIHISEPTR